MNIIFYIVGIILIIAGIRLLILFIQDLSTIFGKVKDIEYNIGMIIVTICIISILLMPIFGIIKSLIRILYPEM